MPAPPKLSELCDLCHDVACIVGVVGGVMMMMRVFFFSKSELMPDVFLECSYDGVIELC